MTRKVLMISIVASVRMHPQLKSGKDSCISDEEWMQYSVL